MNLIIILSLIFLITFCHLHSNAQGQTLPPGVASPGPQSDAPSQILWTTPEYDMTDLPDEEIQKALNVDFGTYKYTRFHFQNHQNLEVMPRPKNLQFKTNCISQYRKCLLGQTQPMRVCSVNKLHYSGGWQGYLTSNSYCDVYFDNCRRGYRVWRIIGIGKCHLVYGDTRDNIVHTRSSNQMQLIDKIKKVADLGKQPFRRQLGTIPAKLYAQNP